MSEIDLIITPRMKDIDGLPVGRILPYAKKRMVGPFVFLDHMGPADFEAGEGIDVRPHPHIGLSTVTYLFEGEILHRDSLGSLQPIRPGDVNWMTSGRGITHSERTSADERGRPHPLHGLQSWVALPKEYEECAPEFFHHTAASLPELDIGGANLRIVAGRAYGEESPAKILSPQFYVAVTMKAGSTLELPNEYTERALYLLEGDLRIGQTRIAARTMPVFHNGDRIIVEALRDSKLMLLGGDPFPEARYIDWNFVSSDPERLLQAKQDWRDQKFPLVTGDEKEFIPLPDAPKSGTIL
ncbi:MAG: pirin family protein [Alphaproteobacteria bacterium]|nr:pirin family protein [Alphaproteobacteria bacterium]